MKHWQEKRNYQHVRDEAGNVRSNIITVDGIDVEVSDEVYLAYTQLDRRERYLMFVVVLFLLLFFVLL